MNDLTPLKTSGALAVGAANFFEQYEDASNGNRIVGDFLKFSKGDWVFGKDAKELPRGTRLVANMPDLKVGWQRWEGGKPADVVMGRVMDGFSPPARVTLGDNEPDAWERDEQTGQPRDPWQKTNTLILKDEKGEGLYTFSTSSKGGIGAIAKVAGEFGRRMRSHPDDVPVVALEVDSYQHPNRAFGRIKTPVLKVVGWTTMANARFGEALTAEAQAAENDDLPF